MSQPTMSRLENLADCADARTRSALGHIDLFCRSYATPPAHIVLDIDDTDDPVHGQQELALFNAHCDCTCFQPIHIFDGTLGQADPVAACGPASGRRARRSRSVLRHVIHRIRRTGRTSRILVRGDSHYCAPQVLDLLRKLRCDYILGFAINTKLDGDRRTLARAVRQRRSKPSPAACAASISSRTQPAHGAESRKVDRPRRGDRHRHGRALHRHQPRRSRQDISTRRSSAQRGNAENLIKDMKRFTRSDKTACSRWQANQFRLFLHMGAYWLLHSLRRRHRRRSRWRGATFETIRRRLREDRRARRGAEGQDQARLPGQLPHADASRS